MSNNTLYLLTPNNSTLGQPLTPSAALDSASALEGLKDPLQSIASVGAAEPTLADLTAVANAYAPSDFGANDLVLSSNLITTATLLPSFDTTLLYGYDTNNSFGTAYDMGALIGVESQNGFVGGVDANDFFKFSLSGIRDVTLTLTGLEGDADLKLIKDANNNGILDAGELLASSSRSGSLNESINQVLGSGTYFAQVSNSSGNNSYAFRAYAALPQVTVDLSHIKAIDNPDTGWFGDNADYYSKITIDGSTKTTGTISNDNEIYPSNWSYTKTVDGTSRYVSISVELFDSDGGLAGADDRIDIDSKSGYRDLNLWYDLLTNTVSGDVNGNGGVTLVSSGAGDSDRATAWFKVSEGDWYDRNIGDDSLANITRSFSADGINRTDMIEILRETKDYGSVTSTELSGVRAVVDNLYMPGYVENLADKIVNGHVGNTKSGIGNLYAGSSDTQMESLIGKWFLGSDRPDISASATYKYASGSLFQGGISLNDVDQGGVGDCYFIAALGAAAQDKSYVINNMFTDNGDGTFTVGLYKPDGSKDYVTVDRYLPTYAGGSAVYAGWGGDPTTKLTTNSG